MARNKKTSQNDFAFTDSLVSAPITAQPITETIEKNYMPYVMSVIVSRAIPEIDGLKPAHRKLLYTMYKMGLLTGARTKSANVVGQTMKLNPHGDMAIYETLVRLTRGNEALLHPLIDSKGSFGKQYSSDMKFAASRYTEVKLDPFCTELFKGIDKNAVDFVDNYDNTMKEPLLLPTTFPNVLVTPNTGIAVGMASSICSFNLAEVCDGTVALLKKPDLSTEEMMDIIKVPDFSGGGLIIYDREQIREVYETGQGSIKIRARYNYDKEENCIEITEIPYSTSIELIMRRITDLIKEGKLKEVVDFRDEIDLSGFKLALDLRRGTDPEKLMSKLFKMTPLEDSFKCNFNILINSVPRQMGLIEILNEWIKFRIGCLRRELTFDLKEKKAKLHLLNGLAKLLLDIDKAISIIRSTEHECDVVPNLEAGFDIDTIQAEYIADIKLRYLNREYIINRIKEIENLKADIAKIEETIENDTKIKALIAKQLLEIKKKYAMPRRSLLVYPDDITEYKETENIENYNVRIFLTRDGYFKKITLQSLRGNDEQALKDGDRIIFEQDADNLTDLIFFTNKAHIYRARTSDFECVKASVLGSFVPAKFDMEAGEKPILMLAQNDLPEDENVIFIFKNGKGVRIPLSVYQTKSARKKLTSAYSEASPIAAILHEKDPFDILIETTAHRGVVINSALIPKKATRTAGGISLVQLKGNQKVAYASASSDLISVAIDAGARRIKIPAALSALPKRAQHS